MSYTEIHKGQFKVLAYGDEEVIKYAKEHDLIEPLNIEIENDHIVNYWSNLDEKTYDILTIFRYEENQKHILIKHIEHFEKEDEEDLDIFNRVNKDTFEYICQFYNGGTCEQEIWENNLEHINYENYKCDIDKLTIDNEESYLIYDALNNYRNNQELTGYDRDIINDIMDRVLKIQVQNNW